MQSLPWKWSQCGSLTLLGPGVQALKRSSRNVSCGAAQHYYSVPVSYCWSPALLPQPADWPQSAEVVGFCRLEASERMHYQPPPELLRFLAAGPPPIYIGFGSMQLEHPEVRSLCSSG